MSKYKELTKNELINKLINLENEKFGLQWSTKNKERNFKKFAIETPFLNLSESDLGQNNLIVEGDNAKLLKILNVYGPNLIDFVYIDPPYNTGSKDFMYNDKIINSDDPFRHSKWLEFMNNRLLMTKYIMKPGSIIAISIDNNEYANLKLLCDKVFGESNHLNTISLELTKTQGPKAGHARAGAITKNYEYILLYGKNISGKAYKVKDILHNWESWYDPHYGKWMDAKGELKSLTEGYIKKNKKMVNIAKKLDIKITMKSIEILCSLSDEFKDGIYREADNIYRVSNANMISIPDDIKNKLKIGIYSRWKNNKGKEYILLKNKGGGIDQLQPLSLSLNQSDDFAPRFGKTSIRGNLWKDFWKDMMNVEKEGKVKYNNGKKPVRLIKQLMKWFVKDGDVILDYFAGSGTTAHAVSEFASENNYNLKFITCGIKEGNYSAIDELVIPRMNNIGVTDFTNTTIGGFRNDDFFEDMVEDATLTTKFLNNLFNKKINPTTFVERKGITTWEK